MNGLAHNAPANAPLRPHEPLDNGGQPGSQQLNKRTPANPTGQQNTAAGQPTWAAPQTTTNNGVFASRTDYLSPLITGNKIANSPFLQSVLNQNQTQQ